MSEHGMGLCNHDFTGTPSLDSGLRYAKHPSLISFEVNQLFLDLKIPELIGLF